VAWVCSFIILLPDKISKGQWRPLTYISAVGSVLLQLFSKISQYVAAVDSTHLYFPEPHEETPPCSQYLWPFIWAEIRVYWGKGGGMVSA
jgi:hypothetical protein